MSAGGSDRHGANDATRHATSFLLDDAEHDGDDASDARRAAVNDNVAKYDKHDANAWRRFTNNHDEQQYNDDLAGRLPHPEGGRRTMRLPFRSDPHRHIDRGRGERAQYLRAKLVERFASGCFAAAIRINVRSTPHAGKRCGW